MLRNHTQHIRPSATLWINERVQQLREEGRQIYHFGFGQSPFPVPTEVVQALQENAHRKEYLPVRGLAELRKSVAAFLSRTRGVAFSAEQILIGPGSKELIYLLQNCLAGKLYLPPPSWVSYEPQALYARHEIKWLQTPNWKLTPSIVEDEVLSDNYLILNYPSNPTGVSFSESELQALATAFRQQETLVIADEIYGMTHYNGQVPSLSKYYPEGTVITTGLSKWCGAGGWRLGVAAFPKEQQDLLQEVAVMASETYSCAATPIQFAALQAYADSPTIQQYLQRIRTILKGVASYVHQECIDIQLSCIRPEGGFYLFPNFEHYRQHLQVNTAEELCALLLDTCGVAVLPGSAFGRPPEELSVRLAFVDFDGEQALNYPDEFSTLTGLKKYAPNVVEGMQQLRRLLESK